MRSVIQFRAVAGVVNVGEGIFFLQVERIFISGRRCEDLHEGSVNAVL